MFSLEDVKRFRAETAGVNEVIHLNNAGSSLPPDVVRNALLQYLDEETRLGGYEIHEKYYEEIEGVYGAIAQLINADASEIAVLENATVAWSMAFKAIHFQDGDEILTCQADYSSNYLSYLLLQRSVDIAVRVVPNDEMGQIDTAALDEMISEKTRLISLVHVPTNSGLVSPAEAVGAIAKKHGVLYLLDACQSAGQLPLDVKKIGCDLLSATGRKYLRGPRGTGFLYVNRQVMNQLTPPFIDLHSAEWTATNEYRFRTDARRFENWESNFAGIYGLKKAVDYINAIGMEPIWQRVAHLGKELRQALGAVDKVIVHDIGAVQGGIVTFSMAGYTAVEVKAKMAEKAINISWLATPNARLDMEARGIPELARASVHYYNSEEEIARFVAEIGRL